MASRRRTTRQPSSGSSETQGQSGGDGGPNQQLLQQYAEGKKFKVKYLGSQDIEDYRNKRETSTIMADLKRRSSKAPKPKAIITLFTKELIVMDEKSKTVTMKVPVSKVKFVCHNKNDSSLFGIILATDRITSESQRLHRMFCYQADPKISATFVRSVNELFQILAAIMRERRSRTEANNSRTGDQATGGGGASATRGGATSSGGGASGGGGPSSQSQGGSDGQQQQATGSDPMSDDERYEPIPLGFGIEAPPPSYKAAISKKNESIFKKPDDVQTTVNTRLPPPPTSRVKKPAPPPPASRLSAPPLPTGRLSAPPTSQGRRTAAPGPPPQASTTTSQTTPTARNATPASATSLPLPQVPVATVSSGASGGATFNIGSADEEDTGFNSTAEGNIYDVPTNNQPAPPGQGQREAVWQEWQALESELQTIAQDLGFDMDSSNSIGAVGGATTTILPSIEDINIPPPNVASEASFSEDPFADDFFQTSFSSATASLSSQSAWPGASTDIPVAGDQAEDPFSSSVGFETAWGTTQAASATNQAAGVSSENADPFQEILATPTGSSGGNQEAAARDPFQDTATPTSPPVSFDFTGFSSELPWNESASVTTTATSTITQAVPIASFDADFGSDWGALGAGDTSTNAASSSTTTPQAPKKQDSQPEPVAILSPTPQVTTPRRAEATRTPATTAASTIMAPEDNFGPPPAAVPPPPLPKRDSAILKPPPVSPTRRADAISNRNQSTSSRSRPRPSAADQTQAPVATIDSQVVLNRPPKSKSSPSQTRAYSGETEPQQQLNIPSPDFGTGAEVASTNFDAMFDTSTSDNQDSGGVSLTSSVTSDPFQSSFPPVSSPSSEPIASDPFQSVASTSTQAAISDSFQGAPLPTSQLDNIGELFSQENLSPPSSTVTTSQVTFDDPFQGGTPQTSTATSELSLGNPFQEVSPQHASLSTAQQAPVNDLFQGGFPPVAVSGSASTTTSDDLFGDMAQPSAGNHDPFQSSTQPPASTEGTTNQAKPAKSPPESGSEGGGDNWSGFGDMWSSKKQETTPSSDWSAAFGGTGGTETAASKQKPVSKSDGWSDSGFGSQPQQQEEQKQPANVSFSGFGDNWSGLPDGGNATASTPQNQSPFTSKPAETSSTSMATSVSQSKTESPWNVFGQDSFSTGPSASLPSSVQSQPQVQQKSAKSAGAGLLPPPSKSSRPGGSSGSPLSSHSRPRARPSGGERGPGILNPPSSQKAQGSSARGGQVQRATATESTSNPLNKSEVSTKKSGSYLDDLSSLTGPSQQQQPQFSSVNMNMNYPGMGGGGAGGPLFQQQQQQLPQAGGWGSPPGPTASSQPFSQQPMQTPPQQQQQAFQAYGGPQQAGGGGMPPQQQQQQQQQQYMQQQQAMFMQQQQAIQQMQQGPPGSMQQGPPGQMQRGPPGQMQQGPPGQMQQRPMQQGPPGQMQQRPMQQGPPGAMQQGPPGSMQGGYASMQQIPPGQMAMQQGVVGGMQFSPGGPQQMISPPGQGGQIPGPPQFSTPQQQQQYYYQQQQQQQNPNAFSPTGQPNSLTPGNTSMGGGQFSGSNLSTSHLNASGFSSPPYAVGSSTPQSGTPGTASSPPAPAELPPATVEYRPSVNDGRPDPFAALVTGALSPSKDGKVKGVDAERLKAAFIKQPSPNRFPSPGPTYYGSAPNNSANPQGGWV